ncbi:MAG: class I SAM-dependent methyltransferase, partial [Chloroflexota bacterium]
QMQLPSTPKAALDVGCGLGWSLDYFAKQVKGIEIAGVEPSNYCAEHVTNVIGAELVGRDVDADWHISQVGRFDIVVMRMVAEHLLDPIGAFKKVRETLSSKGLFYIAIPNMMNPAGSLKKFWYRIVHTYYYSKTTLTRIAGLSGLEPVVVEVDGAELWGIFKRKDNFSDPNLPSVYAAQIKVLQGYKFKRFVRAGFQFFGIRMLGKLLPKAIKNRVPEGLKKKFRKAFYGH